MKLLLIDTSTERGLIGFSDAGVLYVQRELPYGLNQSKYLLPYLAESLRPFGFPPAGLNAIGVAVGPGSYTGIRLGVAAAQALAYSWGIPLVGFSTLDGFIPENCSSPFAALLDARIGGVYVQTGYRKETGEYVQGYPQVCSLEELEPLIADATHFVTPAMKSLQSKLERHFPGRGWIWQERPPSLPHLVQVVEQRYQKGKIVVPPNQLQLLYLRESYAAKMN